MTNKSIKRSRRSKQPTSRRKRSTRIRKIRKRSTRKRSTKKQQRGVGRRRTRNPYSRSIKKRRGGGSMCYEHTNHEACTQNQCLWSKKHPFSNDYTCKPSTLDYFNRFNESKIGQIVHKASNVIAPNLTQWGYNTGQQLAQTINDRQQNYSDNRNPNFQ
jgi:hypothetical protein